MLTLVLWVINPVSLKWDWEQNRGRGIKGMGLSYRDWLTGEVMGG